MKIKELVEKVIEISEGNDTSLENAIFNPDLAEEIAKKGKNKILKLASQLRPDLTYKGRSIHNEN